MGFARPGTQSLRDLFVRDNFRCGGNPFNLSTNQRMDHIEAFILAGGASSRMGTDKSQLLIDEESFTQRIADTLFKITSSVTLVGHDAGTLGLRVARDVYPSWGALGGLHGALNACQTSWAIVVACDLPFVTAELLEQLANERNEHEAVVPFQPDGRLQPLCALYRVDPCLKRATVLIDSGHRRPLDLIESVKARLVLFSELKDLELSQKFFVNINTPEDYYEATRQVLDEKT